MAVFLLILCLVVMWLAYAVTSAQKVCVRYCTDAADHYANYTYWTIMDLWRDAVSIFC